MGLLLGASSTLTMSMRGSMAPFRVSRIIGNKSYVPRGRDLNNARRNILRTFANRQLVSVASSMENPFKYPQQMDGLQSALSQLPSVGIYAVGAALALVLGGAGASVGQAVAPEGVKTAVKTVTGLVGAAAAAYITIKLKERRQSAAIIELANQLVELGNPTALTRDMVAAIEAKYGIVLAVDSLEELKILYGTFVEAAIPPGDAPLTGQEPVLIQNFKSALGLQDVDAAPVHIDVGRRILRGRLEAGTRGEDAEARKSFQKLIYISSLVFGERQAAFLLPWARVFGLTDAQLQIARRDNARNLFKSFIAANGGSLKADKAFLASVKAYQQEIRLADDEASATIQDAARTKVEECLDVAIQCIKKRSRARDYSEAVAALREAIDFNRGLAALSGDPEVSSGVGATSVAGSAWEATEGRNRDLRDVFRIYVEEILTRDGAFTDALEADGTDLRTIMGLGTKEAASIESEVKEKMYRKLLREEVTSGRLDAATSKAEVLGELVEKVRFDPDAAKELHRSLYKQKLSTLLENKKLSEDDINELARLQRLLCVPNDDRNAMHAELCGAIFKDVVNRAMGAGIDGFGFEDRRDVKNAFEDLKMERAAARAVLDEVARKYMLQFISASRNTRDRIAAAKELKKMVFFSNIIVAPLLDDLKTDEERKAEKEAAEQQRQIQEIMAKAREDAERKKKEEAEGAGAEKTEEEKDAEAKETADALLEQLEAAVAPSEDEKKEEGAEEGAEVQPKSLAKAEAAAQARADGEKVGESEQVMKSQKDITLANDLAVRDRVDIYRNFLMYCMTGDVMQGPMGVQMVTERDESEFARLSQLGDVLGLSQMDVYDVHKGLAEQAFKNQVQAYMSDGQLTPDRATALDELREKMGLPKEAADKIIKGFQNQKLISAMQAAKAQGQLTLDRVLELKDAGVEVNSLLNEDGRLMLYRQEVTKRLTDGTGSFEYDTMVETLPANLELDKTKAEKVVKELANERKRTTLVQAVSFLRQKKVSDAIKSLNNLRSCAAAIPGDSSFEKWNEAEEVADLYSLYCSKESDDAKRANVQTLLGLSDADAANLRSVVEAGGFKLGQEAEEEEAAFF